LSLLDGRDRVALAPLPSDRQLLRCDRAAGCACDRRAMPRRSRSSGASPV